MLPGRMNLHNKKYLCIFLVRRAKKSIKFPEKGAKIMTRKEQVPE